MEAKSTFISWLALPIIIVVTSPIINAQSVDNSNEFKSNSLGTPIRVSQERHPVSKVIDGNGDRYKLLFRTSYEGKLGGYLLTEKKEIDRASRSGLNNFIGHLDEAGKQGYRIFSSSSVHSVAIVGLDERQYEYKWFETTGSIHFAKSGLTEKIEEMSAAGFRLVEHSQLFTLCDYLDSENPAFGENCTYSDLFLFERAKGSRNPVQQVIVSSFPAWGGRPSLEITAEIEKRLAEGFYPVKAISKFEILLEKAKDKSDILDDKPDVQIVRSGWGNLQKKVNGLAKQGYRLAVAYNGIAVMYRNRETNGKPVFYTWLRTDKKKFEKELAKLQQAGVRYVYAYPNEHGTKNSLIFESTLRGKGAEFRVLSFDFAGRENKNEGKVYIDLTPASKEEVKTMNSLAKEGFVVRDLRV